VCALYPSLFVNNLPSSSANSIELDDLENEMDENQLTLIGNHVELSQLDENSLVKMSESFMYDERSVHSRHIACDLHAMNNLETTSEGLCDYVREIFNLSRSVFNEYQMKAVRKLLTRKSHAQILKEELRKQHRLIQADRHPIYKLQNFQVFLFFYFKNEKWLVDIFWLIFILKSQKSFETWKEKYLRHLEVLLKNLDHVPIDEEANASEETLVKYIEKLKRIPVQYEKLVVQIFRNLGGNNGLRLTSNSKRLLKEFQLRFCVVSLL